ncbi:Os10g0127350, partial [Oryza sativa Japonica Group]
CGARPAPLCPDLATRGRGDGPDPLATTPALPPLAVGGAGATSTRRRPSACFPSGPQPSGVGGGRRPHRRRPCCRPALPAAARVAARRTRRGREGWRRGGLESPPVCTSSPTTCQARGARPVQAQHEPRHHCRAVAQGLADSQWFEVDRGLAADVIYFPVLVRHRSRNCYADEHYLPTFLGILHLSRVANQSVTWVHTRRGSQEWGSRRRTSSGGSGPGPGRHATTTATPRRPTSCSRGSSYPTRSPGSSYSRTGSTFSRALGELHATGPSEVKAIFVNL